MKVEGIVVLYNESDAYIWKFRISRENGSLKLVYFRFILSVLTIFPYLIRQSSGLTIVTFQKHNKKRTWFDLN